VDPDLKPVDNTIAAVVSQEASLFGAQWPLKGEPFLVSDVLHQQRTSLGG